MGKYSIMIFYVLTAVGWNKHGQWMGEVIPPLPPSSFPGYTSPFEGPRADGINDISLSLAATLRRAARQRDFWYFRIYFNWRAARGDSAMSVRVTYQLRIASARVIYGGNDWLFGKTVLASLRAAVHGRTTFRDTRATIGAIAPPPRENCHDCRNVWLRYTGFSVVVPCFSRSILKQNEKRWHCTFC